MLIGRISTSEHQYILVGNFLLLISQLEELLVDLVELLLVIYIHAVNMEAILQGCTTRAGCQYDSVIIQTHILRVDDFISLNVLQHAILVDTGRMSESIAAHNRLVRLNWHVHQAAHHARHRHNLGGIDVGINIDILVALQNHGDFLE